MNDLKDITSILPEAHFDLVARVVPGCVAVVGLLVSFPDLSKIAPVAEPFFGKFGLGILTLLIVYMVGLVLDIVGDIISEIVVRTINRVRKKSIKTNNEVYKMVRESGSGYYPVYLKMAAESVLLRSLVLLLILNNFAGLVSSAVIPLLIGVIMLVLLFSAYLRITSIARNRALFVSNKKEGQAL